MNRDENRNWSAWGLYVLPIAVALGLYLAFLPQLDVPVWDDANHYLSGYRLLTEKETQMKLQWSPTLRLLAAGWNLMFRGHPVAGYFGYLGFALGGLAVGVLICLRSWGAPPLVAGLSTCVVMALIHWIHLYSPIHLLACAMTLLTAAYLLHARSFFWRVGLPLVLLTFLTRNESILILAPLIVAGHLKRRQEKRLPAERHAQEPHPVESDARSRPHAQSAIAWIAVVFVVALTVQSPRWYETGHLDFSFRQCFVAYAKETAQFGAGGPWGTGNESAVLQRVFGADAAQRSVGALFLANPSEFMRFLGYNLKRTVSNGLFARHTGLSHFLEAAYGFGLLGLVVQAVRQRRWWLVWIALGLAAKLPLVLLVHLNIRYLLDVILMGAIGTWCLWLPRRRRWLVLGLMAPLAMVILPSLGRDLADRTSRSRPNLERARFVQEAVRRFHLEGRTLAELHAPFSECFGSRRLADSVPIQRLKAKGDLIVNPDGRFIDLILVEENEYRDWLPASVQTWTAAHEPLVERPPFSLYMQVQRLVAVPGVGVGDLRVGRPLPADVVGVTGRTIAKGRVAYEELGILALLNPAGQVVRIGCNSSFPGEMAFPFRFGWGLPELVAVLGPPDPSPKPAGQPAEAPSSVPAEWPANIQVRYARLGLAFDVEQGRIVRFLIHPIPEDPVRTHQDEK